MIEPDGSADARERIERNAVDWLIALQDAPNDAALRARFAAWRDADPAHHAAWAEIEGVSRLIAATRQSPAASDRRDRQVRAAGRRLFARIGRHRTDYKPRRYRAPLIAAAAVAGCLALVATPGLIVRARADAVAGTSVKSVRLADGSVARLAAGSALAVDFSGGKRSVRLLTGEGYFDVAHDPARPFRVEAGNTITTVLGTAFEVRKVGVGVVVAVRRGRVGVACRDRPAASALEIGQTLDLSCGVRSAKGKVQPSRIAPWVEGRVVAADQPMREIIDALRPWYGGLILARGDGLDKRRVTGIYDLHHPEQALRAVAAAHHATVLRITPWILVISTN